MDVYLLDTPLRIHPPDPVEVVVLVDGRTLRTAIEWPAIVRLLETVPPRPASAASVADAIRHHRRALALAIEAYLFANGFPLSGQFTITLDDLRIAGTFRTDEVCEEIAALGHA